MTHGAGQLDLASTAKEIWSLPDELEKLQNKYDPIVKGLIAAIKAILEHPDFSDVRHGKKLALLMELSRFFAEQSLTLRSDRQKAIEMVTEIADEFNMRRDGIVITPNDSTCSRTPE